MREVVIIGGGLSGLAAAWELERLKIPCTLIEVKKRLGGSIVTEKSDGFVIDGGAFVLPAEDDWSFLDELGLKAALFPVNEGLAFKDGTQTLVDTLARPLSGTKMMRMAVSTLGYLDGGRFALCMENGLVLDARALIVTAPARHAERMFHTLAPDISYRLLDYRYDPVARVSLGYRNEDVAGAIPESPPSGSPVTFIHHTDSPHRVPSGHILVQVGVRINPAEAIPRELAGQVAGWLGWPATPVVERVHYWPEADPVTARDPAYGDTLAAVRQLLPEGVALVGSDYTIGEVRIGDRITQGRNAAQKTAAWLNR